MRSWKVLEADSHWMPAAWSPSNSCNNSCFSGSASMLGLVVVVVVECGNWIDGGFMWR